MATSTALAATDAAPDDVHPAEVRVIEADDSYVTHWPCGIVLPTRFDGVAWLCPRCGRMR